MITSNFPNKLSTDEQKIFNQFLYEFGIDDVTRSKLMGHKNSKITNKVYTHLSEQKAHEVNIITKTIDTKN